MDEVLSFLNTEDKQFASSGSIAQLGRDSDIAFDRVSFKYASGDDAALSEASFTIPAGQRRLRLWGRPWRWKINKVMKLLLRFL